MISRVNLSDKCTTSYHTGLLVDHIVTYVLYHSDQVSPVIRDMKGKWFTCLYSCLLLGGQDLSGSPKGSLK